MGTLLLKRGIAAIAAGAVSLATVPAFALSIGVNGNSDTALTVRNRHAQASANASARAELRDDKKDDRRRVSASASGTILAKDHAKALRTWEQVKKRTTHVLEKTFKLLGKTAKRFCLVTNDTDALRNSCVAALKADIQAKVTAMINASF